MVQQAAAVAASYAAHAKHWRQHMRLQTQAKRYEQHERACVQQLYSTHVCSSHWLAC